MTVAFYMDVHVHGSVTEQLELRDVDVITAQDDAWDRREDEELLLRATHLGRVVFTQDADFLRIAAEFHQRSREFAGIVYGHQMRVSIGQCVLDLELIARCYEPSDMLNRIEHLPL